MFIKKLTSLKKFYKENIIALNVPSITQDVLLKNFELFDQAVDEVLDDEVVQSCVKAFKSLEELFPKSYTDSVWVLSTGRCGTLGLNNFLQKSKFIMPFHRNPSFWEIYAPKNQFFYTIVTGAFETNYLGILIRKYLSILFLDMWRAISSGRQFCVVRHGQTPFCPLIFKLFPEAKFIYLLREPKDVFLSFLLKDEYKGQIEPLRVDKKSLTSRLGLDFYPGKKEISTAIPLEKKICWYIFMTNLYVSTFIQTIPTNKVSIIRSEELYSQNKSGFEKLQKVLHIDDLSFENYKEHFSTPTNKKSHFLRSDISQPKIEKALQNFQNSFDKLSKVGRL